jgi:hypothetical protein
MWVKLFLAILLIGNAWAATAQDSLSKVVQWGAGYGNILAHSEAVRPLSYSAPIGVSAAFIWQHARAGHSLQHPLPSRKGIRFQYYHFGNPAQLGSAFCATVFTEPMFGSNRNLFLSVPIDLGLVGLSKVHHPTRNPENQFFSMPVSFYLHAGAQINYKLNQQWLLHSSILYQHISNGGMRMPNKGMNFVSFQAGLSYYLNPPNWHKAKLKNIPNASRNDLWQAYLSGSTKTLDATQNLEPILGMMLQYAKPFNHFHGLSFGAEWHFNQHLKLHEKLKGKAISGMEIGVLTGYRLSIGRTHLNVWLGVPMMDRASEAKWVYQRYMLSHDIGKHLVIAGSLKAEGHVADIFDVRLGWRFTR